MLKKFLEKLSMHKTFVIVITFNVIGLLAFLFIFVDHLEFKDHTASSGHWYLRPNIPIYRAPNGEPVDIKEYLNGANSFIVEIKNTFKQNNGQIWLEVKLEADPCKENIEPMQHPSFFMLKRSQKNQLNLDRPSRDC